MGTQLEEEPRLRMYGAARTHTASVLNSTRFCLSSFRAFLRSGRGRENIVEAKISWVRWYEYLVESRIVHEVAGPHLQVQPGNLAQASFVCIVRGEVRTPSCMVHGGKRDAASWQANDMLSSKLFLTTGMPVTSEPVLT